MNNNVITTSQNIKGDISTCTVNTSEIDSGRSFWIQNQTTIAINNCTGSTTEYQNWSISAEGMGSIIFGGIFLFVLFFGSLAAFGVIE